VGKSYENCGGDDILSSISASFVFVSSTFGRERKRRYDIWPQLEEEVKELEHLCFIIVFFETPAPKLVLSGK
jgi:hypothetical protein